MSVILGYMVVGGRASAIVASLKPIHADDPAWLARIDRAEQLVELVIAVGDEDAPWDSRAETLEHIAFNPPSVALPALVCVLTGWHAYAREKAQ
jgi:hypothetical protein